MLLGMLDEILYTTLETLFNGTDLMKSIIIVTTLDFDRDKRRRMSAMDGANNTNLIIKSVIRNNFKEIKNLRIDRSIVALMLEEFIKTLEPIKQIEWDILDDPKASTLVERQKLAFVVGTAADNLWPFYIEAKGALEAYYNLRAMIMSRYYRLAYHRALKTAFTSNGRLISKEDLYKSLIVGISRAVEKCNPHKGTLTPYVLHWFTNVENNFDMIHEFGVSYDVPYTMRKKYNAAGIALNNFSLPIDDAADVIMELENDPQKMDFYLLNLLHFVPGTAITHVLLNHYIELNDDEKAILRGGA